MSPETCAAINKKRLDDWKPRLTEEHATAVAVIGIGHDHKSGEMTVVSVDEIGDDKVMMFLQGALKELRNRN